MDEVGSDVEFRMEEGDIEEDVALLDRIEKSTPTSVVGSVVKRGFLVALAGSLLTLLLVGWHGSSASLPSPFSGADTAVSSPDYAATEAPTLDSSGDSSSLESWAADTSSSQDSDATISTSESDADEEPSEESVGDSSFQESISDDESSLESVSDTSPSSESSDDSSSSSVTDPNYTFVSKKQLQLDIAAEAVRMMQAETDEEAAKSIFVDISYYVELMNVALDELGLQGLLIDFFSPQEHAAAMTEVIDQSEDLTAKNFEVHVGKSSHNTETVYYDNIPTERPLENNCHGCLYWLTHHLGSITADKLLREGSIRLNSHSDERLTDAISLIREMQRIQRGSLHDKASFQVMHGFMWTYIPAIMKDLSSYPLDLVKDYCGDLLWKVERPDGIGADIGEKCRHGIGHGVYYVLAQRQLSNENLEMSVKRPLRPAAGFTLSEDLVCDAIRICHEAPNALAEHDCLFGIAHTTRLLGRKPLLQFDEVFDSFDRLEENKCQTSESVADDEQSEESFGDSSSQESNSDDEPSQESVSDTSPSTLELAADTSSQDSDATISTSESVADEELSEESVGDSSSQESISDDEPSLESVSDTSQSTQEPSDDAAPSSVTDPNYTFVSKKQLQLDIAAEAVRMMQTETDEEAAKSMFVDISYYVDLMNVALDELGLQGLLIDFFSPKEHAAAMTEVIDQSEDLTAKNFEVYVGKSSRNTETVYYDSIPTERPLENNCHGCLYWLTHHLGEVVADKLLREGSIRLNSQSDERLTDATSLIHEMQRIQRVALHDRASFQVMHGFMWTYIPAIMKDLSSYPLDLVKDYCGDLLWKVERPKGIGEDIGEKCRHGIGHGVYYVMAQRQLSDENLEMSVKRPLRPAAGFTLSEDLVCDAIRICHEAPNALAEHDCLFGIAHTTRLLGRKPLLQFDEVFNSFDRLEENKCQE